MLGGIPMETATVAPAPALGQSLGEAGRRAPEAGPEVTTVISLPALAAVGRWAPEAGPGVLTVVSLPVLAAVGRWAPEAV